MSKRTRAAAQPQRDASPPAPTPAAAAAAATPPDAEADAGETRNPKRPKRTADAVRGAGASAPGSSASPLNASAASSGSGGFPRSVLGPVSRHRIQCWGVSPPSEWDDDERPDGPRPWAQAKRAASERERDGVTRNEWPADWQPFQDAGGGFSWCYLSELLIESYRMGLDAADRNDRRRTSQTLPLTAVAAHVQFGDELRLRDVSYVVGHVIPCECRAPWQPVDGTGATRRWFPHGALMQTANVSDESVRCSRAATERVVSGDDGLAARLLNGADDRVLTCVSLDTTETNGNIMYPRPFDPNDDESHITVVLRPPEFALALPFGLFWLSDKRWCRAHTSNFSNRPFPPTHIETGAMVDPCAPDIRCTPLGACVHDAAVRARHALVTAARATAGSAAGPAAAAAPARIDAVRPAAVRLVLPYDHFVARESPSTTPGAAVGAGCRVATPADVHPTSLTAAEFPFVARVCVLLMPRGNTSAHDRSATGSDANGSDATRTDVTDADTKADPHRGDAPDPIADGDDDDDDDDDCDETDDAVADFDGDDAYRDRHVSLSMTWHARTPAQLRGEPANSFDEFNADAWCVDHMELYALKRAHALVMAERLARWRAEAVRVLSVVCDGRAFPPVLCGVVTEYVRHFG